MTRKYRNQLTFLALLRHAFMSGAGYGDLDKISEADQARWVDYDPQMTDRVKGLMEAIERPTPKAPQDMNLRELFDHVAIVNDAIRAALLTHPGMTPMRQEPTPRQCASCGGYSHASFKKCVNCSAVLG